MSISFDGLLGYIHQYPQAFALVLAVLFSWAAALFAERVFFNPGLPLAYQKKASITITVVACIAFALILWPALDPHALARVRIAASSGVGLCSPFAYILITGFLGNRFPWLASVFTKLNGG